MKLAIPSRTAPALLLIAAFTAFAAVGGPTNGWDSTVAAWFGQLRLTSPDAASWAAAITLLGGAPITLGIALVVTLWLLARRRHRAALLLAATVLIERLTSDLLKDLIGRPRPHVEHLPASLAFPSGHAANSMTTYLAIALIAAPPRYRRPAILAALAITIVVGMTRLVLGVHWASDVFGGWTLGLLAVGLAVTIGERSGVLRLESQHDVIARHIPPVGEDKSA